MLCSFSTEIQIAVLLPLGSSLAILFILWRELIPSLMIWDMGNILPNRSLNCRAVCCNKCSRPLTPLVCHQHRGGKWAFTDQVGTVSFHRQLHCSHLYWGIPCWRVLGGISVKEQNHNEVPVIEQRLHCSVNSVKTCQFATQINAQSA